jgi:hypothetical protein
MSIGYSDFYNFFDALWREAQRMRSRVARASVWIAEVDPYPATLAH